MTATPMAATSPTATSVDLGLYPELQRYGAHLIKKFRVYQKSLV